MSSWIEGAFLPAMFVQGPLPEGFLPACAYRSTPTLLLSKLHDGGNTIPLHTPQEETIMVLAVHFVVLSHLQPLTLKFSIQKSSDSNIPSMHVGHVNSQVYHLFLFSWYYKGLPSYLF
ncbi:hypothetical protein CHARACLAT_013452 [Characodon lateralis]|uniref:Uncharacterized protein n=1 Tax=Characodon lateralis TaxID=208331 RepID=A0ABU7DAQ7_9TELE|nr:hypothetical protein [Characodon lateralis]